MLASNFLTQRLNGHTICMLIVTTSLASTQLLFAQRSISEVAQAELQRRNEAAVEAQVLLQQGDSAYNEGDYAKAVKAYAGAISLLPEGAPVIKDQRKAALERYSQASVEQARYLSRMGNIKEANEVIDAVLADDVAPNDLAALEMREELNDPILTNPALTKEHAQDINKVRILLYKAEGEYQLGNFDKARAVYEDVMRVDPYNTAARRGMEKVVAAQTSYYRAAYDEARSEMLSMVANAWETNVTPKGSLPSAYVPGNSVIALPYEEKLESSIVPVVILEDVTLDEAIDFFRQQSIALDIATQDPEERGINVVIDVGDVDSPAAQSILSRTFSLNLRGVTLSTLLNYICEATGTMATHDRYAITILPSGSQSADMMMRTFRVPPDFLTRAGGAASEEEISDPFGDASDSSEGLLPKRATALEILQNRGIEFPEGSSATFNPGNSTLRVRNTPANLSMVEQIVSTISSEEPTSVVVDVKVIRTQQTNLEELGFDWILGNFNLGGSLFGGGGTTGNGGNLGDLYNFPGSESSTPITAGNRSGDEITVLDSIDSLILNRRRQDIRKRAPGVLAVNGLFTDGHVGMLMRGLNQKTGTDIQAVPSVTTRSGQQASIRVVQEMLYPTEYEPPEIPQNVGGNQFVDPITGDIFEDSAPSVVPITPATPTAFEMREVGVILEVLPTVSKNKRFVDITLNPDVVEFDGFINYGSAILAPVASDLSPEGLLARDPQVITENEILMPVFSRMTTNTALTVADNSTIVIGGLLNEQKQTVHDKTPILGDIPFFGRLFRSDADVSSRSAIIFLVKVRVVDAAGRPFNP